MSDIEKGQHEGQGQVCVYYGEELVAMSTVWNKKGIGEKMKLFAM